MARAICGAFGEISATTVMAIAGDIAVRLSAAATLWELS